jgi:hypothetical protein
MIQWHYSQIACEVRVESSWLNAVSDVRMAFFCFWRKSILQIDKKYFAVKSLLCSFFRCAPQIHIVLLLLVHQG